MGARYQLPTDNIVATATIAVKTGTPDAAYPIANLTCGNPAKPFKLASASGTVLITFTAPVALKFAAVFNHNLPLATGSLSLQGHDSDAWPGDYTEVFPLLAAREDGFSRNPFVDMTVDAPSWQYWLLSFATGTAAYAALGELWLSLTVRTWPNTALNPGGTTIESHPVVEHRTGAGVGLFYDSLTTMRSIRVPQTTFDADRAVLATLWRSAHGRAKPFVVVPDTTIADAMLVRLASTRETLQFSGNVDTETLALEELSSGIPL